MPDLLQWAQQTRPSSSGASTPKTPGSNGQTLGGVILPTPGKNPNNNNLSGVTQVLPPPGGNVNNSGPVLQAPVNQPPKGWIDLIFDYWAYILVVIIVLLLIMIIVYFYFYATPSGFTQPAGPTYAPVNKPTESVAPPSSGLSPFIPTQNTSFNTPTQTVVNGGKTYEMIELADGAPVPPGFMEMT